MRKTLIISALAGVMATTSVMPAFAFRATEATLQRVRSEVRNVRSEIRELRNDGRENFQNLLTALRRQTGEQSAYSDKQIEAYKRIQDAAQQNDTDRVRQQIRAKAESGEFDPNPDACLLLDLFGRQAAPTSGAQGTAVAAAAVAQKKRIGGLGAAAATREMATSEVMINGHDATKRASSFLETPTVNMTQGEMSEAAQLFVLKLLDSSPMVPVPDAELNTPEGVAKKAAQETRENRESIVLENWAMLNNMSSNVVDGQQLRKWAEGTPYNRDIPESASELQALDVMTIRHYAPPVEEASSPVQVGVVLQKIHQLTAIQARMQYLQLEMDRRNLLTQSAILAKLIQNDGK